MSLCLNARKKRIILLYTNTEIVPSYLTRVGRKIKFFFLYIYNFVCNSGTYFLIRDPIQMSGLVYSNKLVVTIESILGQYD